MSVNPEFGSPTHHTALNGPVTYPWASGSIVAELQELLRAHGFDLRVDGDFGDITETAVKAFQRQQGLFIDGVVGRKTWAALKAKIQPGTRALREGLTGSDVGELQGLLGVQGFSVHRDGIFGADTRHAVLAFQRKHRLRETGIVDSITWTTLRGGSPLPPCPKQTGWFVNNRKWW